VVFSPTPKGKTETAGKVALGASNQSKREEVGLFHALFEELTADGNKIFNYF
jgi:hypothetical protein